MNDLSNEIIKGRGGSSSNTTTTTTITTRCNPIPAPVLYVLIPLFFVGLAVSLFIFIAVRNAIFLISLLLLSLLIFSFLFWNAFLWRRGGGVLLFLATLPDSDLRNAVDGQLVKVTGFASCGTIYLESSYEKVPRCVYTSTLLYEFLGFGSKLADFKGRCFQWNLAYSERFATDFYITDAKSGMRTMVKAGYGTKVTPLIGENILVNTTRKTRVLSSYLRKWLVERNLSPEARLLRLEEGYIKEGSSVTVVGMFCRSNDVLMIVEPPEPIFIGCLWQKCLLPSDVDGLILKISDNASSVETPPITQDPGC